MLQKEWSTGDMNDFWVFGYGSLMWDPGFRFEEEMQAWLFGFRRSLCVWSQVYRGTPQRPGLVLGLDRGGSCRGVAFRVREEDRDVVLDYLRQRELVTNVYEERTLPVTLEDGERVMAVAYVADRQHVQYAGSLAVEAAADIVFSACGNAGPNDVYVLKTVAHMQEIGIRDKWMEGVASAVKARRQAVD